MSPHRSLWMMKSPTGRSPQVLSEANYDVVSASDGPASLSSGVRIWPTTVMIDNEGIIQSVKLGAACRVVRGTRELCPPLTRARRVLHTTPDVYRMHVGST